jgi:hypothetical protein
MLIVKMVNLMEMKSRKVTKKNSIEEMEEYSEQVSYFVSENLQIS